MGSPYNPDLSPQGRDDISKIKGTYGNGGFGNAGVVCSFHFRGTRSRMGKKPKEAQFRLLEAISACPEE